MLHNKIQTRVFLGICGWAVMLGLLSPGAQARQMRIWSPEELYTRADLIIVGMPLEVSKSGRQSDIQADPQSRVFAGEITRAEIEVNHIVKGASPDEISVEYTDLSPDPGAPAADAPVRLSLEPFAVYVMYLQQDDGSGVYRPILENDFDSEQSALMIAPPVDFSEPSSPAPPETAVPSPSGAQSRSAIPAPVLRELPPAGGSQEQTGMTTEGRPRRTYVPQSQRQQQGNLPASPQQAGTPSPNTDASSDSDSDARAPLPVPVERPENAEDTGAEIEIDPSQRDYIGP